MTVKRYTSADIAAMIAAASAKRQVEHAPEQEPETPTPTTNGPTAPLSLDSEASAFQWNSQQQEAISLALSGRSFCLIGAAGTGKTTTTKEIVRQLIASASKAPLAASTKFLTAGSPGIIGTSFTRRAVRNLRRALSTDMAGNCLTTHALLEFEPVFYDIMDEATGDTRTTMRFEPTRTMRNQLPSTLSTIIVDEGSMLSTELFELLTAALPYPDQVQFIFLGDLNQLPPVYGRAILGFKLNELPVVELTQIYRQALESPIIRFAHRILEGSPLENEEALSYRWLGDTKLVLRPWKKQLAPDEALGAAAAFIRKEIDDGRFDEEDSVVLCPYNVNFGTIELNRVIAQHLGQRRYAVVHEVIAGFQKYYLAEGDRVLVEKEDAIIQHISHNARYLGQRPQPASTKLDRWGALQLTIEEARALEAAELAKSAARGHEDVDALLDMLNATGIEDRKQEASHVITLRLLDSDREVVLNTASELNNLLFSYALTVHKSQGSEWRRVYCMFHHSHATMISRELLYTAVTRAREELHIIFEPVRERARTKTGTFYKGIVNARIKGNGWREKAEFFKGLTTTGELQ